MTFSSRPRETAVLSEPVLHRLNMYAIAAGATGVGLLAMTQSAEGNIIYTPAHVVIVGMVSVVSPGQNRVWRNASSASALLPGFVFNRTGNL
jgi:hypothetical protein